MREIESFVVYFYIGCSADSFTFAFRRLSFVPQRGDICVFNDKRYLVSGVEWCLDEDATDYETQVNVELTPK